MDWLPANLESSVKALLAGFVAAWIFHGLTAHPKASPFERGVQALIFTAIVRVVLIPIRWMLFLLGYPLSYLLPLAAWSDDVDFVWSMLLAVVIGFTFSWAANRDLPHSLLRGDAPQNANLGPEPERKSMRWLRAFYCNLPGRLKKLKITKKTAYPSEWFNIFNEDRDEHYVVLHLAGERRLYGWVAEFPDRPETGHFCLHQPVWLLDTGEERPLPTVERTLVRATDVWMVEFVYSLQSLAAGGIELEQPIATEVLEQNGETSDLPLGHCNHTRVPPVDQRTEETPTA